MEKKEIIAALNEDLSGELGAIIQYLTYAAKTTGPYRPQLSEFFRSRIRRSGRRAAGLSQVPVMPLA